MTNKFWVGGSGNWSDDTNHWALSSGGLPGAGNLPTPSDPVFFDSLSNPTGYTVTFDAAATPVMLDLNMNNPLTGVITWSGTKSCTVSGNLNFQASTIAGTYNATVTMNATSSKTITTSGWTGGGFDLTFNGVSGVWTLQDALTLSSNSTITITKGTFDANGFAVATGIVASSGTATRVLTMGSGTWSIISTASASRWGFATSTGITLTSSGTIKFTGSTTNNGTFAGGGLTYNNFWNATGNTGSVTLTGSNTFADFKIDAGRTQKFTAATTTTVTTFTAVGASTVITSATAATHTLSAAAGTISVSNCTIDHSIATGGATWNAFTTNGNVDGGNNTGWIFTDPGDTLFAQACF